MRLRNFAGTVALLVLLFPRFSAAQQEAEPREIRDNSFLLEEAYNQEEGVIQHILAVSRFRGTGDWAGTFTEEWPVKGMTHQLSLTVAGAHVGEGDSELELGDLLLNYRYQLTGGEADSNVSVSPRLSLVVPTGDVASGTGSDAWGFQVNLPTSLRATDRLVFHWNAGGTWLFDVDAPGGGSGSLDAYNFGASGVWVGGHWWNALLEASFNSAELLDAAGARTREDSFFLNPGVRFAFDVGDLQIVPGLAYSIGIGPSRGEEAVFLYLSLEHPFGPAR